jgi:hypothetical protein
MPPPEIRSASPASFLGASTPGERRHKRRANGKIWSLYGHRANIRRGSDASAIWDHGEEFEEVGSPGATHAWICDLCDSAILLVRSQSSWNVKRHLSSRHNIVIKRGFQDIDNEDLSTDSRGESDSASCESSQAEISRPEGFGALISRVNIDRFRDLLIRWIVKGQVSYSIVKLDEFRDLLLYLQPSIERYLVRSHSTIASWVQDEFNRSRGLLKAQLAESKSRIHLSFDIWTSPSSLPILGICSHFLSSELSLKQALLGLKVIEGAHEGETIARVIAGVIEDFEIEPKLGVFVADNATNNDTAIKALVSKFRPSERDIRLRRSRCFGHIINLAAKAFLLGNNFEAFIDEVEVAERRANRDEQQLAREQALWRSRGPIGKFHNIVAYIRASPQRRQEFALAVQHAIDSANARGKRL